jgi:hypothetical protein
MAAPQEAVHFLRVMHRYKRLLVAVRAVQPMEERQVQEEPPHAVMARLSGREAPVPQVRGHPAAAVASPQVRPQMATTRAEPQEEQAPAVLTAVRGRRWEEPASQEIIPEPELAAAVVVPVVLS